MDPQREADWRGISVRSGVWPTSWKKSRSTSTYLKAGSEEDIAWRKGIQSATPAPSLTGKAKSVAAGWRKQQRKQRGSAAKRETSASAARMPKSHTLHSCNCQLSQSEREGMALGCGGGLS
ncbi:hypothetical protein SRHO_G00024670 [Serrasalmus rhombeus]